MHGARPLSDLGAGRQDAHASGRNVHSRLRRQTRFAVSGETGPVVEQGQSNAPIRSAQHVALVPKVCPSHRFGEYGECARILAQHLTSRRRITGAQRIEFAQRHAIHPQLLGDAVHVYFDRELGLRRTESAKRTIGWRIREHRATGDPRVRTTVRTRGVNTPA